MSTKLNIVNTFESSTKKPIVFLVLIGLAGLFLRLIYFPYDVPLLNDGQSHFWYAIDMSILKEFPPGLEMINNGWPSFLSLIFQLMDSNNFIDYHNMQRFVGVIFSVATIFPVYLLCNRFFKKSYSLIGAALIAFEPKLLLNSLLGLPDSAFIFLMATLLCLYFSNDIKKIYLAFAVAALLALVRYEGLLVIIPISIMFFIRFRNNKKNLKKYFICICIFILIILPMAHIRSETMGVNHESSMVGHLIAGPNYYQASIQNNSSALGDFLYLGSVGLIKFFGWAQIPSFIIFIPLGIIFIFKKMDYKKSTIIFTAVVMLLPAFYAYSRDIHEVRYIFVLYPIFCIFACFSFKIFLEKSHRKNLMFILIISGIFVSSVFYIDWKAMNNEHYLEAYEILTEIGQKEMKINKEFGHGAEFTYVHWIRLQNVDEFPILKKELPPGKITYTGRPPTSLTATHSVSDLDEIAVMIKEAEEYHDMQIDNLRDYFQVLEKQKITHLILDEKNNSQLINDELRLHLSDIFNHENEYPFLIKEYDSRKNGYSYYVKLFKIDYDKFNEWNYGIQ